MSNSGKIHPTAQVDVKARLAANVAVGAFSVIGPDVEIGEGTQIGAHVVIEGPTTIGRDNQISPFCMLGSAPQHKAHKGEPTRLEIGDRNVIREYISMHRGTMVDQGLTKVGNDNYLMAYVHLAHDCVIGNSITMANGASLAGHSHIGDFCILGGFALIYQFTHVGRCCYLGFGSHVTKNVPPFLMIADQPGKPHGINAEGMRRRGFAAEEIDAVRKAYKLLYRSNLLLKEAREQIAALASGSVAVQEFLAALEVDAKRGIIR